MNTIARRTGLSLVSAALLAGVGITMPAPAQAATTQRVCSSGYSGASFTISNPNTVLLAGACAANHSKDAIFHNNGKSYRVGYNYGSYSGCRTNNDFNYYDGADVAYFKTYNRSDCTNTITLGASGKVPRATAARVDNSYWLTNSSSNSGAFDCYVYKGGKWHKVNDGHTFKGMTKKTLFKCDHTWYATSVTGVAVTGKLKKNKNYRWSSVALKRLGDFKWAVAFQY